jgi:hypothetical protein
MSILETATHAYIAREKCCGAVSAATIEGYEEVAEEVASWIRGGRIVERVTREEARRLMRETKYPCDCEAS